MYTLKDRPASQKLLQAIQMLKNPDRDLKPVPAGCAREDALILGLNGLAETFGKKLAFTRIDARGEMDFNLDGADRFAVPSPQYGEELAGILSTVPWRCGMHPSNGKVSPEGNWLRLNHFDAERLLLGLDIKEVSDVSAEG